VPESGAERFQRGCPLRLGPEPARRKLASGQRRVVIFEQGALGAEASWLPTYPMCCRWPSVIPFSHSAEAKHDLLRGALQQIDP
jgi:hypothetical protein